MYVSTYVYMYVSTYVYTCSIVMYCQSIVTVATYMYFSNKCAGIRMYVCIFHKWSIALAVIIYFLYNDQSYKIVLYAAVIIFIVAKLRLLDLCSYIYICLLS